MISFTLPLVVPSVANLREHWSKRAKRVATQRKAALLKCPKWTGAPLLVVTLTRVAPRELDSDNLASALKGIRDGVAARLGVDDGSALVSWRYGQERGEPAVRVEVLHDWEARVRDEALRAADDNCAVGPGHSFKIEQVHRGDITRICRNCGIERREEAR